mmetsp:Transcript_127552/g.366948  ORF Transcript_127552/g.366948 Transcript_127552/m.366948 type:complete len:226 (-) Transcript_127552:89-766(-)
MSVVPPQVLLYLENRLFEGSPCGLGCGACRPGPADELFGNLGAHLAPAVSVHHAEQRPARGRRLLSGLRLALIEAGCADHGILHVRPPALHLARHVGEPWASAGPRRLEPLRPAGACSLRPAAGEAQRDRAEELGQRSPDAAAADEERQAKGPPLHDLPNLRLEHRLLRGRRGVESIRDAEGDEERINQVNEADEGTSPRRTNEPLQLELSSFASKQAHRSQGPE